MINCKYLTPQQVAAEYGIPQETLQKWRLQGKGPRFSKLPGGRGGAIRYLRDDLDAYMEQHVVLTADDHLPRQASAR